MNSELKGLNIDDTSVRKFAMMGCNIVLRRITESGTAMVISALPDGTYVMQFSSRVAVRCHSAYCFIEVALVIEHVR